jgi:hypothetical protein
MTLVVLGWLVSKGGEKHVTDGLAWGEYVILGDIAEAGTAAQGADPGINLVTTGKQPQERRFAGPVGTNQADSLTRA